MGKGNAFLNDLVDADVLIHVVDASSSTTIGGAIAAPGEGSDPLHDIQWVHDEMHQWIFNNVRRKWRSVLRYPSKLAGMFSGYRASRRLVAAVLHRAGVPTNDAEPIVRFASQTVFFFPESNKAIWRHCDRIYVICS